MAIAEEKQHVGCSVTAYQVIMEDYVRFNPAGKPLSKDRFLNTLLVNCNTDVYVRSVVGKMIENKSRSLKKTKTVFTGLLTGAYKCRNESFNIYQTTIDAFVQHDRSGRIKSEFYKREKYTDYISILFEIYAELPYLLRERIIIRDTVLRIQNIINDGKMIQFGNSRYSFIPYAIRTDSMGRYLYACGLY